MAIGESRNEIVVEAVLDLPERFHLEGHAKRRAGVNFLFRVQGLVGGYPAGPDLPVQKVHGGLFHAFFVETTPVIIARQLSPFFEFQKALIGDLGPGGK